MADTCELWIMNKTVNPQTRRRIISNGPTYKRLQKKCLKELEKETIVFRRESGILATAKRFAVLLDSKVFDNRFEAIEIELDDRKIPESFVRNGKITIVLPRSLRSVENVAKSVLHEMCLVSASMFGNNDFDFWRRKAGIRFPSLNSFLKCYPDVSGCDPCGNGKIFVAGEGDCGQLGLGPDVMERSKLTRSLLDLQCVQACAGGLHTVCLTVDGLVYSFGCNDEFALGRQTPEEDDAFEPRIVPIRNRIVQISAGGSHSAALTDSGKVYVWGTFRDSNGAVGLVPGRINPIEKPFLLKIKGIIKISSGSDHILFLRQDGRSFSMGINDQGQLGRETASTRDALTPSVIKFPSFKFIVDAWAFQYGSVAKTIDNEIYAWGLNNYFQLGFATPDPRYFPEKPESFNDGKLWKSFSGSLHHTLAISMEGDLYSIGNGHYGRLGVGRVTEEPETPILRFVMTDCESVSTGTISSYAISLNGNLFSWGGEGNNLALGTIEKDVLTPIQTPIGSRRCVSVSGGGQHVVALMCE